MSAQVVLRCDTCEDTKVHSYCAFCHVNLCTPCKEKHTCISDGSTLIYPQCGKHPHRNCEFECNTCEHILVCSTCIASVQHAGHVFVEVLETYSTKKKVIKKDANELKRLSFPKYEDIVLDLKNQLANLDVGYGKLTTEITRDGKEWKKQIDIVINKMRTDIDDIKLKLKYLLSLNTALRSEILENFHPRFRYTFQDSFQHKYTARSSIDCLAR